MNQPEKRFKAGACTASIFANEVQTSDGPRAVKNVVLQRTFKDKEGKWQATSSFTVNDIPKALCVLQMAYRYLVVEQGSRRDQNA